MPDGPLLAVRRLAGGYGDILVVSEMTLSLEPGRTVCITGRNGVGKTTFVRLATGSLTPSSGTVEFLSRTITEVPSNRRRNIGIGYAPQENVVFDGLTVRENLTLHHDDRSLDRYRDLFDRFPRIPDRLQQRAGTLSGGEKKILSFCRVLAEDTSVVFLDEPTEGVQPENISLMAESIAAAKSRGRAFVIVELNLGFVEQIADEAILMENGGCSHRTSNRTTMRAELSSLLRI